MIINLSFLILIMFFFCLNSCVKKDVSLNIINYEDYLESKIDHDIIETEQKIITQTINNNIQNNTQTENFNKNDFIKKLEGLSVDDEIVFGKTEQDNDFSKIEDIEWVVKKVDSENKKVFVVSKKVLDCMAYKEDADEKNVDVSWEDSDIRKYLNEKFYNNSFNDAEKEFILDTENVNADNEKFKTKGGNNTKDKLFLLSVDESIEIFGKGNFRQVKNYITNNYIILSINKESLARPTEYAKGRGVTYYQDKDISKIISGSLVEDQEQLTSEQKINKLNYEKEKVQNIREYLNCASYWLRSVGAYNYCAAIVDNNGMILEEGRNVKTKSSFGIGLRPCMWISYDLK